VNDLNIRNLYLVGNVNENFRHRKDIYDRSELGNNTSGGNIEKRFFFMQIFVLRECE
jgi:hypothetical protein